MAATYEPIATTTLGSSQSSVTFSSISGSYTDLIAVFNGSHDGTTQYFMQVGNGSADTGSNYSTTVLDGTGSSAVSGRYSNDSSGIRPDYYATGGGNKKMSIFQLQNYSNTTTYKTVLVRSALPASEVVATVNLWRSTSAINVVKFTCTAGYYESGSTFTLYGIKAA
jgi:hypothetical protein